MQNVLGKIVKMELLQEVYVQAYMYKLNCIVIIGEIFKVLPFWPLEFA